jgi:ribosomal protein S18 acetylase RimI-like enzyme
VAPDPSPLTIRPVCAADREPLHGVLVSDETFRADEIFVALELIDGAIAGDPDYLVLVAEAGSRVAGYACYGPTAMTRATYDLYWIVVGASARGRGIGRALLDRVEAELHVRGGGNLRVETSPAPAHAAARALYARSGYPIAAELADFYAPGEALLVYYKHLGGS